MGSVTGDKLLEHVLAFFSGGALVAILGFVQFLLKRRDKREKEGFREGLEQIHEVYAAMYTVLHETPASRVMVLRAENNGTVPRAGCELFGTVIYEVTDGELPSRRESFVRQRLDGPYVSMLNDVAREEQIRLVTDDMDSGLLRDLYESDGVAAADVMSLNIEPGEFMYLSMQYALDEELDAGARDAIRACLTKIRLIFAERPDV